MSSPRVVSLMPFAKLSLSTDSRIIAVTIGPSDEALALILMGADEYRKGGPEGASLARAKTDRLHDYLIASPNGESETRIVGENWNYHHAQPLESGRWLLVGGRAVYRTGNPDQNARVFDANGRFQTEFALGDGIQDIQVTADGRIWTSYFDEGVAGNRGWPQPPIGREGLICWSRDGEPTYRYIPPAGLDVIVDCYAMNVTSKRDTWICYYPGFPLVKIRDQRVAAFWSAPEQVHGSAAFAIFDRWVLFQGGYVGRGVWELFELRHELPMRSMGRFDFRDEHGEALGTGVVARGDNIVFYRGDCLYSVRMSEILSES